MMPVFYKWGTVTVLENTILVFEVMMDVWQSCKDPLIPISMLCLAQDYRFHFCSVVICQIRVALIILTVKKTSQNCTFMGKKNLPSIFKSCVICF